MEGEKRKGRRVGGKGGGERGRGRREMGVRNRASRWVIEKLRGGGSVSEGGTEGTTEGIRT